MHFQSAWRKFLGYLISCRGIEANPEKIEAIQDMSPSTTKKEVQKLTGRMAALSKFLRGSKRGLPFFKTLRKVEGFSWNEECQEAFDSLKEYLSKPPLLMKPQTGEKLYIHQSRSEESVSAVLVRAEEKEHQPVYYVARVLIADNRTQFQGGKLLFISVYNPQVNRQAEVTNLIIRLLENLRRNTFQPGVWIEAILLAEIGEKTWRVKSYDNTRDSKSRREDLNLVEEKRETTEKRIHIYKSKMARAYDDEVRPVNSKKEIWFCRKQKARDP
ncbi:UNVERIFIED_CONTAM: hypothetical protein Scaly_2022200 [Sesamum calycinum]|uniref:Reverse transcriptase/retrotransposon-derived protein RNase H-like domain-containing protein n=1 Tax=Sesamum calycinum TaxID=2727403 RepID=A0AAW2N1X1_9LAMI